MPFIKEIGKNNLIAFILLSAFTLCSLFAGIFLEQFALFLVPFIILFIYICVTDFRKIYFLLLFFIPLSMEIELPGGFSTDLPAEPLMVLLMGIFFLFVLAERPNLRAFLMHPLNQLLWIHLLWIIIACFYAEIKVIAFKFFLAKIWYVTVFVYLTAIMVQTKEDFKKVFWCFFIPLCYTIILALIKHASYSFSFDDINKALRPFYRNHVNYAALLSIFFPFIVLVEKWYDKESLQRQVITYGKYIFILGIIFAYTRGAWIAFVVALLFILALNMKLIKTLTIAGSIGLIVIGGYLLTNNNYLQFAPEFSTTIYHGNLQDHLSATTEMKDVSAAERVYRWVAASKMSTVHPFTGFGPNNFYHHYKSYSISDFSTYVSDNPEKSGTHNYFLMVLTEQGFIGLIIFILFTIAIFHYGIKLYYDAINKDIRDFILAVMASFVIMYVQLMLSDLIEALKIGIFFFLNLSLLITLYIKNEKEKNETKNESSI